jgi:hypothetical protein
MASILISSDLQDEFITEELPKLFKVAGHNTEVVHPLEKIGKHVEFMCFCGGGVDVGVLVQSSLHSTSLHKDMDMGIATGIVTDMESPGPVARPLDSAARVATKLRAIPDSFVFKNSVKAKSLPLLVIGKYLGQSSIEFDMLNSLDWVATFDLATTSPDLLPAAINDLIFKWRTALLRELDCVGYAVIIGADGALTVNPSFKKAEMEGTILAPQTNLALLKDSGYLIVSSDLCKAAASYKELAYLVDNFRSVASKKKTKPEEIFQDFFNKNPHLIFQQSFAKLWPKPRLHLPEHPSMWLEPDFVVKPSVCPQLGSKWKVLDIKLPDVKLTRRSKFHPGFSANLSRALQQVANYRAYFARPDAAPQLTKIFGLAPVNPQLAVLIGREPSPAIATALDRAFQSTQVLRVEIITYDEVLSTESQRIAINMAWLKQIA